MASRPLPFDLVFSLFSLKKGNMRSVRLYRISIVFLMIPLFCVLCLLNNLFLLLDHVFFFRFKKQAVDSPVFITSLPRTGTTYLLHGMNDLNHLFTTIKLWESIFAPSVIQKLIFVRVTQLDTFTGGWGKKCWLFFERISLQAILKIHRTGMNHPEEDELMLLWSFETAYFSLFYPDSEVAKDLFRFDSKVSNRRKLRIMNRYKRLVQRHMYVFSDNGSKRFVSKNPMMIFKLASIKDHFSDALILTIDRNPSSTVPSTIALNRSLIALSSDVTMPVHVVHDVEDLMVDWYSYLHKCLTQDQILPHLEIDFTELTQHRSLVINQVLSFLDISFRLQLSPEIKTRSKHITPAKYDKLEGEELTSLMSRLHFLKT